MWTTTASAPLERTGKGALERDPAPDLAAGVERVRDSVRRQLGMQRPGDHRQLVDPGCKRRHELDRLAQRRVPGVELLRDEDELHEAPESTRSTSSR